MKCSFCGFEFDARDAQSACQSCFLKKGCDLVQCPNCRYEQVIEASKTKRALSTEMMLARNSFDLTRLEVGQNAVVVRVPTEDKVALRKLIAMGIMPDTEVRLIQKFPSYVFQSGYERFTIDRELAVSIEVKLQ